MQTLKFSRLMTLVTVFVVALLAAACSPSATTPTAVPGAGDTATTVPSTNGESAAGNPTSAAQGFFDALLTGGDAASFVCTTAADAKAVQDGYKQMAAAYAAAKISTDGLTYTASNVTADKATVAVGGNLSIDTAGVVSSVPFQIPSVAMINESGTWKVC